MQNFSDIIGGLPGSGKLWGPTEGDLFAEQHAVGTQRSGSLTEHSDEGLGGSHRHGEDGACVLPLICQRHVADADTELVGSGANQLNPVISKGWGNQN